MMKAIMRDEREMKDSGIEYLGIIPNNWNVASAKYFVKISNGSDPISEGDVPVYGSGKKSFRTCGEYKEGPAVLLGRKGTIDIPQYIEGRYWNVDTAFDVKNKDGYSLRYYYYLSTCFDYKRYSTQTALPSMTQSNYNDMRITVPVYSEQNIIANYLDDRCSKIDAIIAEAKASIEEYKELKISMVNDAVTHGIKDNADIDSDIDWIGKIPANWRIMIMKRLFKIRKDIAGKEGYTVLSITQRGIVPKNFKENGQFAADYSNYQLVNRGDFAMNHMDLLTGWVDISEYDGVTSPDYRVFVPTGYEEIYKPYYKYVMQNCYSCKIFYGLGHGVSGFGRWRLPKDMFLNFKVPLPPIEEQKEIASYIDNNLQKLDALISTKQSLIEDLESYKKSLIYEVVTGKRKVVE